jgi:alpha-beta hydrolase superfamily lysophospholipase
MRRVGWLLVVLALGACSDPAGPPASVATTVPPGVTPATVAIAADQPGSVVSSTPATFGSSIATITGFRLRYRSVGVHGDLVEVTGAVLVPTGVPPEGGWPVVSWAHGTTGVADDCAPSLLSDTTLYTDTLGDTVRAGYVVAVTDYEGLGTERPHPYLNGISEAHGVIDAVRAARVLVPGTSSRWLAAGHSQGGHAVLFAAEVAADYAPELELVGAVAFAPAAGLSFFPALQDGPGVAFLLLTLAGYVASEDADPAEILTDVGVAALDVAEQQCLGGLTTLYGHAGAGTFLQPGAADTGTALADYLAANEPGQTTTTVPLLVLQGDADRIVSITVTDKTVERLCGLDDTVEYRPYAGADHMTVLEAGAADAAAWIAARFQGPPPTSTC